MSSSGSKKLGARQLRALRNVLPGLVRTAQQSLATRVKAYPFPDDEEWADSRLFWRDSGALKNNSQEFKQHLHIWLMSEENSRDIGHVDTHYSVPWVPLWDRLDITEIKAYYHITNFALMPSGWEDLWRHVGHMTDLRRDRPENVHGPYWKLKDKPTIAVLAGEMAEMKRRVAREAFDKYGKTQSLIFQRCHMREALEPFRVPTGEIR